jgi:hypothetical protein
MTYGALQVRWVLLLSLLRQPDSAAVGAFAWLWLWRQQQLHAVLLDTWSLLLLFMHACTMYSCSSHTRHGSRVTRVYCHVCVLPPRCVSPAAQAVKTGLSGFGAGLSLGKILIEEQACLLNGLLSYTSNLLGSPCECPQPPCEEGPGSNTQWLCRLQLWLGTAALLAAVLLGVAAAFAQDNRRVHVSVAQHIQPYTCLHVSAHAAHLS